MNAAAPIGVGIIGAGFLAETRADCYARTSAQVVAVAARREESARSYAERHGVPHHFDDYRRLLDMPEIDLVDLCVPNLLHRPMAVAAAEAGKQVVCTKPLAAYVGQDLGDEPSDEAVSARDPKTMYEVAVRDARAMVEAARAAGVRLMYGENWIYAPSIRRAFELGRAAPGAILEMQGWEAHMGSHSPYSKLWRYTGGGALLRLGAHPVGAMLYLKAEEGLARDGVPIRPVSVTAEVGDLTRNPALDEANTKVATGWKDVENWGCVIITFSDGSRGIARGSDNHLGGMESKLVILASDHHLECRLSPHDLVRAYASDDKVFGDRYIMEKVDTKAGWSTPLPDEAWSSGHLAMCADFVDAVAEDREALSTGELGLEVTRVIYAAYLAAAEGRRVVLDDI